MTVEQVRDFYRYSEVAKWGGQSIGKECFGSRISIMSERMDSKYVYHGIMLFGDARWAYVSIEREALKYQYTEDGNLRSMIDCPVTTDEKTISRMTKILQDWHGRLGLPESIDEIRVKIEKKPSLPAAREWEISAFGDTALLRIMSDGTSRLLFNLFPPETLTARQADDFGKQLSRAIGRKVLHEDRESFVIFDNSEKMIKDVTLFLKNFQ